MVTDVQYLMESINRWQYYTARICQNSGCCFKETNHYIYILYSYNYIWTHFLAWIMRYDWLHTYLISTQIYIVSQSEKMSIIFYCHEHPPKKKKQNTYNAPWKTSLVDILINPQQKIKMLHKIHIIIYHTAGVSILISSKL